MKKSIEDVILEIQGVLKESSNIPENFNTEIRGVQTDQLPPYVEEWENELFEKMFVGFEKIHGSAPSPETEKCIRFIARAESVRMYNYRKLAMSRLDEYFDNSNRD